MAVPVTMPALGESVVEGTVTRWLKQVGDAVAVDEPLLEVSTDKVDTEIPSPVAGVLLEINAQEDDVIEVGGQLALVGEPSDATGTSASRGPGPSTYAAPPGPAAAGTRSPEPPAAAGPSPSAPSPTAPSFPAPPTGSPLGSFPPPPSGARPATPAPPAGSAPPLSQQPAAAAPSRANPGPSFTGPSFTGPSFTGPSFPGLATPGVTTPGVAADTTPEAPGPRPPAASSPPAAVPPAPATPSGAASASAADGGTEVKLPALGESVTEGTVTRWLKQVGDTVAVDEPLLEVSTDKVDTEIPSPVAGVVSEIRVAEDEVADVGAVLAVIGSAVSAPAPAASPEPAPAVSPAPEPKPGPAPTAPVAPSAAPSPAPAPAAAPAAAPVAAAPTSSTGTGSPTGGAYVTPLVRKMAKQGDVDLAAVVGTGVGGRVRKEDVQAVIDSRAAAAAAAVAPTPPAAPTVTPVPMPRPEPSPLRGTTEKLSRLRRVIADRMIESLQVSAQLTSVVEVDVTRIAHLRAAHKESFLARNGVKLTYMPFFCLAAVEALQQFPQVNASLDMAEGTVTYHGSEHLGIAVDSRRGLLVPVIQHAGEMDLVGLSKAIVDIADRTRSNQLSPDDLSGGTFTITNTGSRGALFDTPIINQPQVAILGTGMVVKRPVVVTDELGDDTIAIRSMVYLGLTYDHRLVDGADAARFLDSLKRRLEAGQFEQDITGQ